MDIAYNPDIITSVLSDMELQLEKKCEQLQKDADFMCTSMQRTFHLELIKLPSQVKKMSLKKFKNEYGESLEAVTKSTIGGKSRSMMGGTLRRGESAPPHLRPLRLLRRAPRHPSRSWLPVGI